MASSLTFGALTTDNVAIAPSPFINDLETKTFIFWFYPTTVSGRLLFRASAAGNDLIEFLAGINVSFVNRQTGTTQVTTTTDAPMVTNAWQFLAFTYDSGATPKGHIYYGTTSNIATERAATQTNGTGTKSPDNPNSLYVSSNAGASASVIGQISFFGMWNRVLNLQEIQDQQFSPHVTNGCVVMHFYTGSPNNTSPVQDLSGKGNTGTPTGTVASLNGPPIFFPGGPT